MFNLVFLKFRLKLLDKVRYYHGEIKKLHSVKFHENTLRRNETTKPYFQLICKYRLVKVKNEWSLKCVYGVNRPCLVLKVERFV